MQASGGEVIRGIFGLATVDEDLCEQRRSGRRPDREHVTVPGGRRGAEVIRICGSPDCGTLTLGPICLACEQAEAKPVPSFVRGRPFSRSAAVTIAPAAGAPSDHGFTRRNGSSPLSASIVRRVMRAVRSGLQG
jgi:hypothetical protein